MDIQKMLDGIMPSKRIELDPDIIRRNRISVLTLDERWNSLFKYIAKTPTIIRLEERMNNLLKKQAQLTTEHKENLALKKDLLKRIMELTTDAFERGDETARKQIDNSEAEINRINLREPEIEEELSTAQTDIKEVNIELLENSVSYLYRDIKKTQERTVELEVLIEELKEKLKESISERETMVEAYNQTYLYLHALLGVEQIEELDRHYSLE